MAAGCRLARPDCWHSPHTYKAKWKMAAHSLSHLSTDAGTLVPFVNSVKNIIFVVALGGYFLHVQVRASVAI